MLEETDTPQPPSVIKAIDDPFLYLSQHFKLPNTHTQQYHRSTLYTPTPGDNPLLAAAGPLLSIIRRLHAANNTLQQNKQKLPLQHELQAFIDAITQAHYPKKIIAAATFCLITLLEDVSGQDHPTQDNPHTFPIPMPSNHKNQLFMQLLHSCSADPEQHLDLMELIYVCLNSGYTANFHEQHQGLHQLTELKNQLYRSIQQQRPNKTLLSAAPPPRTPKNIRWRYTLALSGLLCLFGWSAEQYIGPAIYHSVTTSAETIA